MEGETGHNTKKILCLCAFLPRTDCRGNRGIKLLHRHDSWSYGHTFNYERLALWEDAGVSLIAQTGDGRYLVGRRTYGLLPHIIHTY